MVYARVAFRRQYSRAFAASFAPKECVKTKEERVKRNAAGWERTDKADFKQPLHNASGLVDSNGRFFTRKARAALSECKAFPVTEGQLSPSRWRDPLDASTPPMKPIEWRWKTTSRWRWIISTCSTRAGTRKTPEWILTGVGANAIGPAISVLVCNSRARASRNRR